ncbi:MAG: phosphate transport system regulatory protein PhoU [Acidobacteria bacterium]|nr:MAG: phosphate transport system regulatory protein PhoU [Acidobacteriota bacterium]
MPTHLLRDLERLKKEILTVGSLVEEATNKAILALVDRRTELAEEVREGDRLVDEREVQVEEECMKILALHQPVAADLRFVVAMLKVNNDLERVGDLADNIAARALSLAAGEPLSVPPEIVDMSAKVQAMLRDSLNAVVGRDIDLARKVLHDDEAVDELHAHIFVILEERMRAHPERISQEIQLLSVSRYLERIADLATNIAEDVVFMVDGEVVRHRSW